MIIAQKRPRRVRRPQNDPKSKIILDSLSLFLTREAKNERDTSILAPSIDDAKISKLRITGRSNQKACSNLFNFDILDQYL